MSAILSLRSWPALFAGALLATGSLSAADPNEAFLGRWALTIPGGGAGWLEITKEAGYYDGSILWGGGSVVPVSSVFFKDDTMVVTRTREVRRRDSDGKVVRTQLFTDLIVAGAFGDKLELTVFSPRENGLGVSEANFTGERMPPLPPRPDLSAVKFGPPISLFNGRDLSGWRSMGGARQVNGWVAEDGMLRNKADQIEGQPRRSYANLRTEAEFEDFNLTLEVRVPENGNSGIYLRGIYEVQVADTHGKPLNSHNMGGIYSRIAPTVNAERPAGEWQTFDITLVDRHVTVILNGRKIIDNEPLAGCTGGALWSDVLRPGPLYLQGDHTSVDFRNLQLRPVLR